MSEHPSEQAVTPKWNRFEVSRYLLPVLRCVDSSDDGEISDEEYDARREHALQSIARARDAYAQLLRVYRTEGGRALDALRAIDRTNAVAVRLETAVKAALSRLDSTIDAPDASKTNLIHAAACAEWISILEEFGQSAVSLH